MRSYEIWNTAKELYMKCFKSIIRLLNSQELTQEQKVKILEKLDKAIDKLESGKE
jgi:hypothetical protein